MECGAELLRLLITVLRAGAFGNLEPYEAHIRDVSASKTLRELRGTVLDIYREVFTELENEKNCSNLMVRRALEFIRENYSKELTVEALAEYVEKTPNYFSHVFKKTMQMSFSEYLNRLRVKKAKELLIKTNMPIYRIGEEAGFHDYAYFTQIFKRYEEVTPSDIRHNR